MKKYLKVLAFSVLALALTLLVVACGPKAEIALIEDYMPQNVFVLGEDIDLTGGKIAVTEKGNTYEVDMTADGVSVSGFDKNTLGKQTVTLTYKKATVDFEVTVVERMTVQDYTVNYLLGDSFDLTKGRLKITRNDGSSFTVTLNSTKVTVTGFSSDTLGEKTLTATYKSDGNEYTATFKVNVREVDEVILKPPTKVSYKSHDVALDLAGGVLTCYGMDGAIKREIKLSELPAENITGFDLTVVDSDTPTLTQTISVLYDGDVKTFDIVITYTSISEFRDSSDFVSDIDWDAWDAWEDYDTIPVVDGELGAEALRIMELYLDMSPAERALIDSSVALKVARVAMVWTLGEWSDDVYSFSDAFALTYDGFAFYCETKEAAENAAEGLLDKTRPLYAYLDFLKGMASSEDFAEQYMYGEMMFADFFNIFPEEYTAENFEAIADMFAYMLELDEMMSTVPLNWRELDLATLSDEIEAVYNYIVTSDYYTPGTAHIFQVVAGWRENDYAFDYLYEYYYGKEDVNSLLALANVSLTSELQEIFAYMLTARQEAEYIAYALEHLTEIFLSGYTPPTDTTMLFYSIYMANKLSVELFESGDEMNRELYLSMPVNGMLGIELDYGFFTLGSLLDSLISGEGGFYDFSGALLGVEEYEELMDRYMNVLYLLATDEGYTETAVYGEDIEYLLSLYMQLTAVEQFTFNGTLSVLYSMGIPSLVFDPDIQVDFGDADSETTFVYILREYYEGLFSTDEAKDAYADLMVATELFTQQYTNANWKTDLLARLDSARSAYGAMSAEDKAVFEAKLLPILVKYEALAAAYAGEDDGAELDYKGWEAKFEQLHEAMVYTELAQLLLGEGYPLYSYFFSAFERVLTIADDILKNAPPEVVNIYLYEGLYSNKALNDFLGVEDDSGVEEMYWSFDYVIGIYAAYYNSYLNLGILQGQSIYDYYKSEDAADLRAFIVQSYDVLWSYLFASDESDSYDKAKALSAIDSFMKLSIEEKIIFIMYMDGFSDEDPGYFLTAIGEFLAEDYSASVADVVEKILFLDVMYSLYDYSRAVLDDEDILAESIEGLEIELKALTDAYEALEGDELSAFEADFGAAYDSIVALVEAAINAAKTENEAA